MAASFVAASSQYLLSSTTPITALPITVGIWFNLAAVANEPRTLWTVADTGTILSHWSLEMTSAEIVQIVVGNGVVPNSASITTPIAAGTWNFAIGRFVSNINRKIAVLLNSGSVEHGSVTTNRAPAGGVDVVSIGARQQSTGVDQFWDGSIAEVWWTNSDIQADGAQLQDATIRQLAYGGPFSVPHVAKDIVEYRSFRKYPSSEGDQIGEFYHGGAGRQTWTNTNGVTTGPHPPLPYWYVKPGQRAPLIRRGAAPVDPAPPFAAFSIPQDVGRLRARMMGY